MNNQDRAAEVIGDLFADAFLNHKGLGRDIARNLHEAGLLAPERVLPHPNPPIDVHKPAWEVPELPDKWVSVLAKKIWITDSHGWGKSITTDQARNLAHALLAAAEYAEEENDPNASKRTTRSLAHSKTLTYKLRQQGYDVTPERLRKGLSGENPKSQAGATRKLVRTCRSLQSNWKRIRLEFVVISEVACRSSLAERKE